MQAELDDDHRLALVAARGQRIDAGNGVDRFFDLLGHLGLDNFRRGSGVLGRDHDHREVDVGELIDLQPLDREQPHHHEGQHDHRGKDRIAKRDLGEPHGAGRGR